MRRILPLLLALGGCAAHEAQKNIAALYGMPRDAVISKLGKPAKPIDNLATNVDEWDYQSQPVSGSLPIGAMLMSVVALPISLTGFSVSDGVAHSCRLLVSYENGKVSHVTVAGDHRGITGTAAWCEELFPVEPVKGE